MTDWNCLHLSIYLKACLPVIAWGFCLMSAAAGELISLCKKPAPGHQRHLPSGRRLTLWSAAGIAPDSLLFMNSSAKYCKFCIFSSHLSHKYKLQQPWHTRETTIFYQFLPVMPRLPFVDYKRQGKCQSAYVKLPAVLTSCAHTTDSAFTAVLYYSNTTTCPDKPALSASLWLLPALLSRHQWFTNKQLRKALFSWHFPSEYWRLLHYVQSFRISSKSMISR